MKTSEITKILEDLAPLALQESYDNSGLLVGDPEKEVTKALICLDITEAVVDEAITEHCDIIIAHHPIIFGGLKKLNGKNYVERVVIKAIQNNISLYSIHTNLDNILWNGVNTKIAEKLGLNNTHILRTKKGQLLKLVTFVPEAHAQKVCDALFAAGAGQIGNYDNCSFVISGEGSFRGNDLSKPFVGKKGEVHVESEKRIEVILPVWQLSKVLKSLKLHHPYEEVAYDVYPILNEYDEVGSGIIGELDTALSPESFLEHIKTSMNVEVIKFTPFANQIQKVAVCGGSGSFLIGDARGAGADAYISSDIKYHEFFDAENKLMLCDIGHYESEQHTIELLGEYLLKKIPNFAVIFTGVVTNPVKYYH